MIKLLGIIFKVINLFVVVLYLSACLIPFLPAGKYWMVAVLGLVFPLLFLVVVLFFVGWIFVRSRWWALSFIALAVSWQQLSAVAGLNSRKEFAIAKPNETIRVLSWNISSWGQSTKSNKNGRNYQSLMLETIKSQQADVLCFQEFWDKRYPNSKYSHIQAFKEMGYPYYYFATTTKVRYEIGVAIFSRYPIADTGKFSYGKEDFAEHLIYADIRINQQKVRVFTTHLQSVRFEDEDYSAISKIKHTDESGLKDSKSIVRKLKNAYHFRGTQADMVDRQIKESPYPVIICGDFNDVPNSYTYFTIKGNLQDTFVKKGSGLGRTFRYISPTLRIDYILADKKFNVAQFNRVNVPYSDHYPVVSDIGFPSL
ncbi:MAG: endonuclease/exonuclease/phosphatase family protein [Ferruginibacter sp.]